MKNTKLFTQFSYLVTNRFAFKDKNVVKVFYIYKDIYNIVLSLDIKKVKDHGFDDETYYINETKKTVTKMISDGSLKKYSEKYVKEKKKNKILRSLLLVLGACALIGACIGIYYALNQPVTPEPSPEPEPTTYSISMVTQGATISPSTFISTDEKYEGTISVTATGKILDGDPTITLEKSGTDITDSCTYTPEADNKSAQLTIEKQYITDNIKVEVALVDRPIYHISMVTVGTSIEEEVLPTTEDYVGTISVTDDNKILDGLTLVTLKDSNTDITDYCDYEEEDDKTASLEIPLEYLTNDIEVEVALTDIEPLRKEELTFTCETAGSLGIYYHSDYSEGHETPPIRDDGINVSYQIGEGEWQDVNIEQHFADTPTEYGKEYVLASLEMGQEIHIRGDNEYWSYRNEDDGTCDECLTFFTGNGGKFKVSNNVMSLLDSEDFATLNTATDYGFRYLFSYNNAYIANISDASDLYLPTNLAISCFESMFSGCTSLVTAPKLLATDLEESCYWYMFENCTSLVNAPALPATTLADWCYNNMFANCTSLVTAPEIKATELAYNCCEEMFMGCEALKNAPALPAETLESDCYNSMFEGCTSLEEAPDLPADDLTYCDYCYYEMFKGCTSLIDAPVLSAGTLADSCYASMFNGCIALEEAPDLPAETLVDDCYNGMFKGCTSLIVLPELPATELVSGCYYEMFSGCTAIIVMEDQPSYIGDLIFTCPDIPEEVYTNPVENMFGGGVASPRPTPIAGVEYRYMEIPEP